MIEQDAKAHPNCSHTTMRQTHATLSKTENLTRIIRQCQGLPPVEVYSHKSESTGSNNTNNHNIYFEGRVNSTEGGGGGGGGNMIPFPGPPPSFPFFPAPGDGDVGGGQQRDLFSSLFEHVLGSVFGGLGGADGNDGGGFGGIFGGAFPPGGMPDFRHGGAAGDGAGRGGGGGQYAQQQEEQQPHHHHFPRPPHAYPYGNHKADPRDKEDVFEV